VRTCALASAAALVLACSSGPGSVHVTSVRASSGILAEPLREAGVDEAALDGAAREALQAAGFALGEGARPHRAEVKVVAVRLAPPEAPGRPPRVEIAVEIALSPTAGTALGGAGARETGTAFAPIASGTPGDAWRAALRDSSRRAAEGLALGFAAEAKSPEKVIADLDSQDARVRDHAVRVLADRRSSAAVPALIARLHDEDPQVVQRAVGALAQIGDERAVGPLIELSRHGDASQTARLARLIGDIGGSEAEGYLLTVESGHSDARVRRAAREALGEMRARAERGPSLSARK
jgi:hypothetical protein